VLSAQWLKEHPLSDGKFSFFIFILIPVQTLFAHNWLTLPLYIERAFRGAPWVSGNFEFFSNLNPLLIFVLTPLVTALTTRMNVYKSMIVGTTIMALPTFLLALGPSPGLLLLYTVLMSVGEALWQPRFLQYVAEIAPPGKTGMYMGVAQFPWFMTKLITGMYSGWFLLRYCPAQGPQDTQSMWFIYSLIACASPIGLLLAQRWVGKSISARVRHL
jgi:dipeptide/tripeptide permease